MVLDAYLQLTSLRLDNIRGANAFNLGLPSLRSLQVDNAYDTKMCTMRCPKLVNFGVRAVCGAESVMVRSNGSNEEVSCWCPCVTMYERTRS